MSAIVLVGVPGAGKTTVGKLLAKELGLEFFDSDQVIEARAGKSVSDIFTQDGEPAFREIEHNVIVELLDSTDVVLALGGGSLGNDEARAKVKAAKAVWLIAGLSQAVDRVGMNRNRPLLLGNVRGQLADLMSAREPFYKEVASVAVDTSNLIPSEVVAEIVSKLSKSDST
jgi:shikimate kinase